MLMHEKIMHDPYKTPFMTPLIICCRNKHALEKNCFCTKCSVDVNFQNLDFLSFLFRFNNNNSVSSSVGFNSLF